MRLLPQAAGARRLLRHRPPPRRRDQRGLRPRPCRLSRGAAPGAAARTRPTSRGWSTSRARGWPPASLGAGWPRRARTPFAVGVAPRRPRRGRLLLAQRGDGRDRRRGRRRRSSATGSATRRSRSTTLPAMFRPLQALENRAPGTQYVNVLATYPAFRRRGVARAAPGGGGAARRGRARAQPDRGRPQPAARRLYAALRLRRGGAGGRWSRRTGSREQRGLGADAEAGASATGEGFKSARAGALHWPVAGSSLPVRGPYPSGRKHS